MPDMLLLLKRVPKCAENVRGSDGRFFGITFWTYGRSGGATFKEEIEK
jgi:hypothetical protein